MEHPSPTVITSQADLNAVLDTYGHGGHGGTLALTLDFADVRIGRVMDISVVVSGTGHLRVFGHASVHASGSVHISADLSAKVTASDHVFVDAGGYCEVTALGTSLVHASDQASVTAHDTACVHLRDRAGAVARGRSVIEARGRSRVLARDEATVHLHDESTARSYDTSDITAHSTYVALWAGGQSVVRLPLASRRADRTPTVRLMDGATLIDADGITFDAHPTGAPPWGLVDLHRPEG